MVRVAEGFENLWSWLRGGVKFSVGKKLRATHSVQSNQSIATQFSLDLHILRCASSKIYKSHSLAMLCAVPSSIVPG